MVVYVRLALLILSFLVASDSYAQPIATLSPQLIEEAIKLGGDERASSRFLEQYKLQKRSGWGNGPVVGIFSTPFSRVVQAARDAHKKYQRFIAQDVVPELIAPEIWVIAPAREHSLPARSLPRLPASKQLR